MTENTIHGELQNSPNTAFRLKDKLAEICQPFEQQSIDKFHLYIQKSPLSAHISLMQIMISQTLTNLH